MRSPGGAAEIEEKIDRFLDAVGEPEELLVTGRDHPGGKEGLLDPADEALPVFAAEEDHGEPRDALGLDEGDDLGAAERTLRDDAIEKAWQQAQAGQGRPAPEVVRDLRRC